MIQLIPHLNYNFKDFLARLPCPFNNLSYFLDSSVLTDCLQAIPEPVLDSIFNPILLDSIFNPILTDETYILGAPLMSPITTRYFSGWLLFDICVR